MIQNVIFFQRAQVFDIPLASSSSNGAPEVSQRPMDLGTVKKRLDSKQYTKTEDALADIQFIFQNAMKIYPKENTIHQSAIETANQFQQMVKTVIGISAFLFLFPSSVIIIHSEFYIINFSFLFH